MDYKMDFENYWAAMRPDAKYDNRKESARQEWNAHPQKHAAIMTWLKRHGAYPDRNPYFFIKDFTVRETKAQEPTNYNGRTLPNEPTATAFYNGKWGTYTLEDIAKFGLRRPEERTTIYVKS